MKPKQQRIAEMDELYSKFDDVSCDIINDIAKKEGPYQLDVQATIRACVIAGSAATCLKNAILIMNSRLSDGRNVQDFAIELLTISRIFDAMVKTYINDCGLSSDILQKISMNDYKQVEEEDLQESAHKLEEYIAEFKNQHPNVVVSSPFDVLFPDPQKMN